MKRKFINGILMLSLVVTAVGSFVSCKDYDEDIYVDLRGRLANQASLTEALQAQVDALKTAKTSLEQQIANINTALSQIKQCECTPVDLSGLAKQSDLNNLITRVTALETAKDLLENQIAAIQTELQRLDQVKADKSEVEALKTQILGYDAAINAATQAAQQAQAVAAQALDAVNNIQPGTYDDTALKNLISALENTVSGLQSTVDQMQNSIQALEGKVANALSAANAAQQKADANAASINSLQNQLSALQTLVNNHINNGAIHGGGGGGGNVYNIDTTIIYSDTTIINNPPYDDTAIRTLITNLTTRIETIESNYATQDQVNEAKNLADKANEAIASLRDSIANGDIVTIGQLRDSLEKYTTREEFLDSISVLRDSINSFSERIATAEAAIRSLTQDFTNLITGIAINQTECPVIGTYNLPLIGHSTMLIGYYGKTTRPITFPEENEDGGTYIDNDERLTDAELDFLAAAGYNWNDEITLQAGEIYPNEEQGGIKAGKVYFTVNPDNVDFTGQTLKVVNSQNVEAPIAMTADGIKRSSKTLQWAYDRSRANNNSFYEASFVIPQDKLNNAILDLKEDELLDYAKQSLKDLKARKYGASVSGMIAAGVTFFSAFDHTLDAYALKATWTDNTVGQRSVFSQYDIAAAALNPLSFNMLQSLKGRGENFGLARLQSLVGRIKNRVVNEINGYFHINVPDLYFTDFEYTPEEMSKFKMTFVFDRAAEEIVGTTQQTMHLTNDIVVDLNVYDPVTHTLIGTTRDADGVPQSVKIPDQNVDVQYKVTVPAIYFEQSADLTHEINKLIEYVNDAYGTDGSVSTAVSSLLTEIEDLNGLANRLGNDVQQKVNNLLVKVYDKFINKVTTNAYRAFDVCLIGAANDDNDAALISMSKEYPTKAKGTLKLIPTSYTLELFAPAFKKFIAVTNVYTYDGTNFNVDPQAQMLATNANQGKNMMKVIDGDDMCNLTGVTGKIYEISYLALDYKGYKTRKKFYVQFK